MQTQSSAGHREASPSFGELLCREAGVRDRGEVDPLAGMEYAAEVAARNLALLRFWDRHELPGKPEPVRLSPRPRRYRTTTRRRVFAGDHGVRFGFEEGGGGRSGRVAGSTLEPTEHDRIYRFLHEKLSAPPYRHLARRLSHVMIRGSYAEFCVIFNVDRMDADIVRKIKIVAGHLQEAERRVTAAFIYHDPLRSRYPFEAFAPETPVRMKRVFGREWLMTDVSGRRYLHDPTAFSQANESALPALCECVDSMLEDVVEDVVGDGSGGRLLDLYCGYGLFSHYLADRFGEILGVDMSGAAIESARRNIRLNPGRARRVFQAREITGHSLPGLWRGRRPERECVILDPPRQGTAPGVIDAITAWQPARVVHIFCEVDEAPGAIVEWAHGGYRVDRIVPVDLFPGTPNLELAVAFSPGRETGRPRASAPPSLPRGNPASR